ncbi:sulfurtransferase TusA family protein [Paenibacillus ferrarius]|uniref:sulfurtransferase TusA family protein n=1 Tax=Paenibacillus ferrarius TaxID=1469647 RepID=UPI003D28405A
MTIIHANRTVPCEGLACPLPVVRTKKAIEEMKAGEIVEVRATDKGSVADLKGWSERTGHQYIGLREENGVYRHFIRKADISEVKPEQKYEMTIGNGDIAAKLAAGEKLTILDVREPAEFAFGHIPGAYSIPLGNLESRLAALNSQETLYVICRTGTRSDLACLLLAERGYTKLYNVLPGMSQWNGPIQQD